MKILVVDDDLVIRRLFQEILIDYKDVDLASDGNEAVNLFYQSLANNTPYDIAFLDFAMPKMPGNETLREFRKCEKNKAVDPAKQCKVFFISGEPGIKVKMSMLEYGYEAFFQKPVSPIDILNCIDRIQS